MFNIPSFLCAPILEAMLSEVDGRDPDFRIGHEHPDGPYLLRWHLMPRGETASAYLHKFLRDDEDRALHDHPYASISILLGGSYIEHMPEGVFKRSPGDVIVRAPEQMHRVELHKGADFLPLPTWSLFLTGPRVREWGFDCPGKGWVPWRVFCGVDANGRNDGTTGKGCAD